MDGWMDVLGDLLWQSREHSAWYQPPSSPFEKEGEDSAKYLSEIRPLLSQIPLILHLESFLQKLITYIGNNISFFD